MIRKWTLEQTSGEEEVPTMTQTKNKKIIEPLQHFLFFYFWMNLNLIDLIDS